MRDFPDMPHRVKIPLETEWKDWQAVWEWCRDNFGDDAHMVRWRGVLAGSPSIQHPEFGDYVFRDHADAILFKLRWG